MKAAVRAADCFTFCDCSPETPKGRRSICYEREALDARKEHKPGGNAVDMASALGIDMLTEAQYRALQTLGEFDTKTSCWVKTPPEVRSLGGALFCDRRYGQVFVYHNGAESYYAGRGSRSGECLGSCSAGVHRTSLACASTDPTLDRRP